MNRSFSFFILSIIVTVVGCKQQTAKSDWRGPARDGVYAETELLKYWPDSGPELIWSYEGLGAGHSSVGIGNNRVYINGMPDTLGVLYSFDLEGNLLWEKVYGEEWHKNYTGPRSTPIVVDELVYIESGMGVVFCFNAFSGEIVWQVDLLEKFEAKNIQWGMAESLLIDGERLICTPGGEDYNIVALNRHSGETIWTSKGYGEPAAYCSPVLVVHNNTRLIVTMTDSSAVGIDADTGEFYWGKEQRQGNNIHANSPVYSEGVIYFSSSSAKANGGLLALKLSEDGKQVEQLWRNESFKNLMGGIIILDGVIYGSQYRRAEWNSINKLDGEVKLLTKDFGGGVIIYADGLFYCYSEKGEIALVQMDQESFVIKGKFKVPLGIGQHWSHPVIKDGRLYVRHGNALMVHNISAV